MLVFIELVLDIKPKTKIYTSVAHIRNKQLCTVENKQTSSDRNRLVCRPNIITAKKNHYANCLYNAFGVRL